VEENPVVNFYTGRKYFLKQPEPSSVGRYYIRFAYLCQLICIECSWPVMCVHTGWFILNMGESKTKCAFSDT